MVLAFIGLGANLGDPVAQVRAAMRALAQMPCARLRACSGLYRTAPVGDADQPDFINAVCALETERTPLELLADLRLLETRAGRVRDRERPNGPRTLDLDLLLYDDLTLDAPGLTLPHPRMHERAFVLVPLQELAPERSIAGRGSVSALAARCGDQSITRIADAE